MDDSLHLKLRLPILAVVCLTITVALVTTGIVLRDLNYLMGAVIPLAFTILKWIYRPVESTLVFGAKSVTDQTHGTIISYDSIVGLTIGARTPAEEEDKFPGGPLIVAERDRETAFPDLCPESAREAYEMFLERIPESGARDVAADLQPCLERDLKLFDEELVFTYCARPQIIAIVPGARLGFAALLLAGIIWIVVGIFTDAFWIGAGCGLAISSLLMPLFSWISRRSLLQQIPNHQKSSIIVTPRGLALLQGPLKGELQWNEIKAAECGRAAQGRFVLQAAPRAISIHVQGALILIQDIYDRPLATIHRCIRRYWQAE